MRSVVTLVLGGGRGTRLYPLTKYRSKPAVPLAGKYRLIDIPLSNCINSGMRRMYVLTQFLSVSLHRHIRQTYQFDSFSGGFVEILAAQQTMDKGTDWYEGTADAVRKNARYINQNDVDYVLILSGDQLYRMDYSRMLRTHIDTRADVTIAAMPVTRAVAKACGVMRCDEKGRVTGFLEKPQTDQEIDMVKMDPKWIDQRGITSGGRDCLASMGIYIFNKNTLMDVLTKTTYQDFGREVFPAAFRTRHVGVHLFDDYWEDIGTVKSFFEANLALAQRDPAFSLFAPEAPIYSRARFLPPTVMEGANVSRSIVADGCRIGRNVTIENCVIGVRSIIGDNVTLRNCVVMGADMFDTAADRKLHLKNGQPPLGIGDGSVIEGGILDKNCRLGRSVRIVNESGAYETPDADDCIVRDGIPVVVKNAALPDGWKLP